MQTLCGLDSYLGVRHTQSGTDSPWSEFLFPCLLFHVLVSQHDSMHRAKEKQQGFWTGTGLQIPAEIVFLYDDHTSSIVLEPLRKYREYLIFGIKELKPFIVSCTIISNLHSGKLGPEVSSPTA